jgi:hypothetical protein
MEKMRWREVKEGGRNDPRPLARWGHCSCLIDDDLIFFGGYAGTFTHIKTPFIWTICGLSILSQCNGDK